jgi:ATP-binding cassette subfamily F protein uup
VLLVSHDRYFVDRVATTILAFDASAPGTATVTPFADLGQWEAWRAERAAASAGSGAQSAAAAPAAQPAARKRLSYKEQREYDGIEASIAAAEATLRATIADSERPENASDHGRLVELLAAVTQRQAEVDQLYARWAELEAKLAPG